MRHAPGKGFWLALYRYLPGFAPVSERAYAFIARRRPAFFRLSLLLWGRSHEPPRYELVSFLFLRLFGLITLCAFVSFAVQAQGLIGSHGILPLPELVDALAPRLGPERFVLVPMVFWLNDSDLAIQAVCWAGAGLSLMLVLNLLPRLSLVLIYALYLSLLYAGQTFMTFQWDTFLLETAVVALLMSFRPTTGVWLARWLLFRFMFMSGVVKLISGDPNWRNLSALSYHFLTQPLPTPLAWYAAQLPAGVLKAATGAMFFVELVLPFLIFCPRRLRFVAAFGILLLQSCILMTGNYNWFNLQTMLLCLPLFDDAALRRILPRSPSRALARARAKARAPRRAVTIVVNAAALLMVVLSLVQMDERFGGSPPGVGAGDRRRVRTVPSREPLRPVRGHDHDPRRDHRRGVRRRRSMARIRIPLQARRCRAAVRHGTSRTSRGSTGRCGSPRSTTRSDCRGFRGFSSACLENEPSVTALLETNPFPDKPPTYVRAELYDYTYAGADDHAAGRWWDRRLAGLYFPKAHLKAKGE